MIETTQSDVLLAFDSNLWDQLPKIQIYNKKGAQMLQSLKHFATSYNQIVHSFSKNLRQCANQLEHEFLSMKFHRQPDSEEDDEYTTLTIAVTSIKSGLDSLASIIEDTTHTVTGDLIEPLDTYSRTYQNDSNESFASANPAWSNYQESSIAVRNAKLKYFDLKDQAERQEVKIEEALLSHDRGAITLNKVQKISQKGVHVKYQAELANQTYLKAVAHYNQVVSALPNTYCNHLQKIQQLEESRINFLKSNLEKMVKQIGNFGGKIQQQAGKLLEQSQFISSDSDLKVFIQRNQSRLEFPQRISAEHFVQSEDLKQYKAELQTRQFLENASVFDESDEEGMIVIHCPEDKVRKLLYQIATDNKEPNQEETTFLVESVKLSEVRLLVQEFLLGFASPRCVQSRACLMALSKTLLALLDVLAKDVGNSHTDLYAIIISSHNLFCFEGNRKCFLTSEIFKHKLWRDPEIWRLCVQKIINFKFHEALKNLEKSKETEKTSIGGIFNNLTKIKGSIFGGKMDEVKKPAVISKALAQNIVFNNLSQFITHFVNFKLPFDLSRELIMQFCKKYELDQSRTHLLVSELESVQISLQYVITNGDLQLMSKLKKEQRRDKYGSLIVVGLAIKFVSLDSDLVKLLRLNKESHRRLQKNVLKQALLLCQPERLQEKRVPIWRIMMQIKENTSDYAAFKAKVMESPELIQNVEEVIMLDVQRSVHNMPGVDSQILVCVLKTYAFYNPEIEYCQGMNFIVGFLLMIFNDEETAFKVLQTLMERFHMADLFNTDLPKLKLFFFQLDRLVSIVDESLHDHFIEEAVNSSYFASAWFITLFTNSLKQNQDEKHVVNENLLQLWDYFLIYGWQAILKMALYVLSQGRNELVQMSFEDILSDINERPKQILTQVRKNKDTMYQVLKMEFKNIPLSFHLERLTEEFKISHNEVSKSQPVKKQNNVK